MRILLAAAALGGLVASCTAPRGAAERAGDAIVVAGRRVRIGSPVVLWTDRGGYDAYSIGLRFPEDPPPKAPSGLRYRPGRLHPRESADQPARRISLEEARERVDQLVLHYDACGTSRRCFQVLHDRRGLSVHFLLDLDGTLYQTLDLADTAWHATVSNARSVGVEIANVGACDPGQPSPIDSWYARDRYGTRVVLPESQGDGGSRTRGFVARPARPERIRGVVQGLDLEMYDYTPQQYESLARLAAALTAIFPRLEPDAPRAAGRVRTDALTPGELASFRGILGHLHVQENKQDPGPAFQWERFLRAVRARRSVAVLGP